MKKNSEIKLSIVVPVFNVKATLEKAVESILSQSYSNFEIILVDDGSTDGSNVLCDNYARKDTRIFSFHKPNGGLSSARNFGLKKAQGDLITFLDSDDFYINDCLDEIISVFEYNEIDIAVFGFEKGNADKNSVRRIISNTNEVLSGKAVIKSMLTSQAIDFYAWNKVYKIDLFHDIEFPEGKLYEDMVPVYEVMKKAEKVHILPLTGIFYFQNSDSIVHQKFNQKQYDNIEQREILLNKVSNDFPELKGLALSRLIDGYLTMGFKIVSSKKDNITNAFYKKTKNDIFLIGREIFFCSDIYFSKKLALLVYIYFPNVYYKLYKIVLKK